MPTYYCKTHQDKVSIAKEIVSNESNLIIEITEGDLRSVDANARYWVAVVTATQNHIERETGVKWTKEAIHNLFLVERYGQKTDTYNGKVYLRRARSSKMSVKQFAKFQEWAERYAIDELGVDPIEIDGLHGEGR